MTLRFALTIAFASSVLLAGGANAGPAVSGGPTHPVQLPPGPCGYGKVQKTVCEERRHPPAQPIKVCKKICVAI